MISKAWPAELMRALQQVEREMPEATAIAKAERLNQIQSIKVVTPGQLKNRLQALDGKKGDRSGVPGWRDMEIDPGPGLFDDAAAPPAETTPNRRLQPVEVQADMQDYEVIGGQFVFAFNGKVVRISRERMDAICADYSEYGGGLTQAELAREHGLPRPLVIRVLRAYGHYKASPPFTRETVAEAAEEGRADDLVERAVEVHERALIRKIEQAQVSRALARLRELESEDYRRRQEHEAVERAAARVQPLPPRSLVLSAGAAWHCHAPTTDEHAGKSADPRSDFGPGYSTDEAVRRLRAHADYLSAWIRSQPGRCTVLHRSFIGDIIETWKGSTASGTPLGGMDASDPDVFEAVLDALVYTITALRGAAERLVIRYVPGNHDGDMMHVLMGVLRRVCEVQGLHDVTVETHRRLYAHFRVGESLHILDHGKGYGPLTGYKARASAEVTAREVAGDDYDGARSIYTYVGHLHESQVSMLGHHHELIRLPALCENNDYETSLRLPGRGGARVFRLDARGRITDEHRVDAADLPAIAVGRSPA